jgi:hypothetical protein
VGEWKTRVRMLLEDFMEKYRNQSRIFKNRSAQSVYIFAELVSFSLNKCF